MLAAEKEEKRRAEEQKKLEIKEMKELEALRRTQRDQDILQDEEEYLSLAKVSSISSTKPLLLDAVVEPLSERNCGCPLMAETDCCKVQLTLQDRKETML